VQTEATTPVAKVPIRAGIATLSGFGLRLAVERRQLVLSDGIGEDRRLSRLSKADAAEAKLRRVVAIGRTGSVSFEALRWLLDAGAGFVLLDREERVVSAIATPRRDDSNLRRAQALASASTPNGAAVTRYLLDRKIAGQRRVLDTFGLEAPAAAAGVFDRAQQAAERPSTTVEEMLSFESQAAAFYWSSWSTVALRFAHDARVPAHWRIFGKRESPFTSTPRSASNCANAVINYLYALLEAETTIALVSIGVDPGLGVFHRDQAYRNSFSCDVMEAVRPEVDAFVLDLLRRRTFAARDFSEGSDGVVRIMPPLSHELGATASAWARLVAPIAEHVAGLLVGKAVPTILSGTRRSRGTKAKESPAKAALRGVERTCRSCGSRRAEPARLYCKACSATVRAEQTRAAGAASRARHAALLAAGDHPSSRPEVRKRIATAQRARKRLEAEWVDDVTLNGVDFKRDILPGLFVVSVRRIAHATGLAVASCARIRSGLVVPHRSLWSALLALSRRSAGH